jgi:glycosyltransferase involved in cell wall biosynthesis
VLITHELYPPDIAGGGEHVVMHAAQGLRDFGVDVQVLTTGNPGLKSYQGVETHRLPISRYRFNLAVRTIAAAAKNADVIQTFTYHACLPSLVAARMLSKPVIMTCLGLFDDAWLRMRGPTLGRCWQVWERFLLTRPYDRVVFLSEFSLELGVAMGVSRNRALVDMPGVETDVYNSEVEKSHKVLFVGKIDIRKGIDLLIAAARALPNVKFQVVGWGPEIGHFRKNIPLNIEVLPFPDGDGLWEMYQRASIFFLPSRAETFGMAILQAMAGGCAIVSTVPLPYEGYSIGNDDLPAMIGAIDNLWSDREKTARIGKRNAEIAREFTWRRFCSRLAAVYDEVQGVNLCR